MFTMKKFIWALALGQFLFLFNFRVCYGAVTILDDTQLFQGVPPDVLIMLDTSGSMRWPPGSTLYVPDAASCKATYTGAFYPTSGAGHTVPCAVSNDKAPLPIFPHATLWYSNASCSGPFYMNNTNAGYTTKCRRIDIAQVAIKNILDNDKSGTVNCADETGLGVRMGYMRFDTSTTYPVSLPNCDYTCGGSNHKYADILSAVKGEADGIPGGSTALASSLGLALTNLNVNKDNDTCAKSCRQKNVILISDGADNMTCDQGGETSTYKGRKDTVKKAKALADAGYKVFVIGFGDTMGPTDLNVLNWAAYYGGTDNPLAANNPIIDDGHPPAITPSGDPCGEGSSNDPGQASLSGYAFMAMNTDELTQALKNAISIVQATYSFSTASVASTRVSTSNYLYAASFEPINGDPFWRGHLKQYSINTDGTLGNVNWDAGTVLRSRLFSDRNIWTYVGGSITQFAGSPLGWGQWKDYLGVDSNTAKAIIPYILGDPSVNADNWKLGDIFHSNPISVGSPSYYFIDMLSPGAFSTFRTTNKDRENIIVVGANDGQFRAFSAGNGSEKWSFIPPNLLPKLQYIAHCHSGVSDCTYLQDKSQLLHTYSVDGPVTVADVWLGTGDGKSKTADKWYTLLVFGEGKGVRDSSDNAAFLWSSSASCDSGFNKEYDSGHKNYCGYYSFDLTTTSLTQPVFKWRLNFTSDSPQTQQYLGEPWSRMAMGKVIINGNEKWVGFIGGGNYKDGDKGKGFFVVDLSTGAVIWSFTKLDNAGMDYRIPASPAIVDTDNDGFVDTAYIGDLGGNIWRFKFCTGADGSTCGISNWSGNQFFQSSSATPVYTTPSVGRSSGSKLWVFWGTGDKQNLTATDTHDSFFGVQDVNRTSTYTKDSLENISSIVFSGTNPGWYISLATGEKVLADSEVFGGMITWATSYFANTSSDLCAKIGEAKLYSVAMMPIVIGGVTYQVGAGLFATSTGNVVGTRSMALGTGIGEMPVFSQKPGGAAPTDVYITSSGAAGQDFSIVTSAGLADSPFKQHLHDTAPSAQVIHWWDQRVQ